MTNTEQNTKITAQLPISLYTAFNAKCTANDSSMSQVVRNLVRQYVAGRI